MRCKKCGAQINIGQTFCLKCGTPIADEDIYQDELEDYEEYDSDLDGISELDVPYNEEEALYSGDTEDLGADSDEIRRIRTKGEYRTDNVANDRYNNIFDDTDYDYDNREYADDQDFDDDYDDEIAGKRQTSKFDRPVRKRNNSKVSPKRRADDGDDDLDKDDEPKDKKKGLLSNRFIQVLLVLLAITALVGIVYLVSSMIIKNSNNEDFEFYYNKGQSYEETMEYEAAINQYDKAKNYAGNDEQLIKSYEGILRCYHQMDNKEAEEISVLKKLISIDGSNSSYYESLILLYQNTGNSDLIEELIDSIEDPDVKKELGNFDASKPVPSIEPGIYNKSISVSLSAPEGSTIYYTLDGSDPTTSSDVYESKFKFKKDGTYFIKAFSVDSDGNPSQMLEAEYVVAKGTVDPPKITPDSGEYSEKTQIEVEIPDGATVYYTNDGTDPSKKSEKYTKKTKLFLPEGNTIYKFIAYNEGGVSSDIVTRIYEYTPDFTYSYDEAVDFVISKLVNDGDLNSSELYQEDGSVTYMTYRDLCKQKKNDEDGEYIYYYIIEAEHVDSEGNSEFSKMFAVNCDSGSISGASKSGDSYSIK